MSEKRRVSVLILFSGGALGGAERSLTRMTMANCDDSIVYELATIGGEGDWADWVREQGKEPIVYGDGRLGWASFSGLFGLIKMLRRKRPNVVYVIGLRAAIVVRLAKMFYRTSRIVHGIRSSFPPGVSLTKRFRRSEKLLKHMTDAYIANSKVGADSIAQLIGLSSQAIRVIPNGIEIGSSFSESAPVRKKIIAVVANIHPLKGHRLFLEVVDIVRRTHADVLFRFIGRDDTGGALQEEAIVRGLSDVIQFCGFQSEINSLLSESALFVLPSHITEGAPTSILEAQAAGLPVVAYAIGGIPELVCDGADGRLIKAGDVVAMAEAINSLLSDYNRAVSMGSCGRRKVATVFSLRACAERHAIAWREICSA